MWKPRTLAVQLLAIPVSLFGQQQAGNPGIDSAARKCEWRPRCSTPGVTFGLEEVKREHTRKGTGVTYRPVHAGFPRGHFFTLRFWPAGSDPMDAFTGFEADSTGKLTCADSTRRSAAVPAKTRWCPSIPLEKFSFSATELADGEPYRLALVSEDGTIKAFATTYAFPLEASNATCHLTLELISRNSFDAAGTGFEPGDTVHTTSRSGDETIPGSLVVNADGTLPVVILMPGVAGKRGGTANYVVEGKNCRVEISYPWGNALKAR